MTYGAVGALASGCAEVMYDYSKVCINLKFASAVVSMKQKKQADLKSSKTNLLKKLDWDVNNEQDLI